MAKTALTAKPAAIPRVIPDPYFGFFFPSIDVKSLLIKPLLDADLAAA